MSNMRKQAERFGAELLMRILIRWILGSLHFYKIGDKSMREKR